MIIGSGLIAQAFMHIFENRIDICVYAAGVSNSGCKSVDEFKREQIRLIKALKTAEKTDAFIYFSTCSIGDPEAYHTAYVQHKIAMEHIVSEYDNHLIIRLPQIAGNTPNPHTLLNYLYAKISRSENFMLWKGAKRNVIDIEDVVLLVSKFVGLESSRALTFNIANPVNYPIMDILRAMENTLSKKAIYTIQNQGSEYIIDTKLMCSINSPRIIFDDQYLKRIVQKYYGGK